MANFNEHALEMSIMELFKDEGYTYVSGEQIHSLEFRRTQWRQKEKINQGLF